VTEGLTTRRGPDRVTLLFGAAIGLSAFLLFTVEPLVGALALPVFGGTPGVWATTLAFFQAVLLLGYLYAHVLLRRLDVPRAAGVHVATAIVAAALALLALGTRAGSLWFEGLPEALNVLVLLAVLVGPAAFLLSATTPLVSAWYVVATERDPYWLYALSNAGSFVGLLGYPFVVEPLLGLGQQRATWTGGLGLLVVLLAAAAARARASRPPGTSPARMRASPSAWNTSASRWSSGPRTSCRSAARSNRRAPSAWS
jgi:hypothetical protein